MHMDVEQSCKLDQFALVKIGNGFAHIGSKRRNVGVVFFGQRPHDLAQCSSVAAGENFVRSFVQFDDAFGEKQNAFAAGGICL